MIDKQLILERDGYDDILGLPPGDWMDGEYETVPQIFCKPDECTEDAENEPVYELKPGLKRCPHIMRSGNRCQLAQGHYGRHAWEASWVEHVRAIEAADEEPLVECAKCGHLWPASEMPGVICPDCQLIADGILPPIEERWKIWQLGDKQ